MEGLRVGVLRGGASREYDVSLLTGGSVLRHLPATYDRRDIFIDRQGVWHERGLPILPAEASRRVDVFFNALHGEYGEDGRLQQVLDDLGVPYTGSRSAPSALGMNKAAAKKIFRQAGIKVPAGVLITSDDSEDELAAAEKVFRSISPPWVVKPNSLGSSVGIFFVRTIRELPVAIRAAFEISPTLLVESYLRGRETTCGVVDEFRGANHYALPPIEIRRPEKKPVWSYEDKYNGETVEICPGNFTTEEKRAIESLAVVAHRALGLRHYSRSDFIITNHGIYLLETNSLPGLTDESLLPKALQAVGVSYPDFLDHVIKLAIGKR